jgi:uncharacterized cupredoxin-like copper-binding protein/Cu/Ag efflux protein CusF
MKRFNTLLLTALLAASFSALSHEGADHKKNGPVHKEQTEWGIAADGKAVQRTVTITMDDTMRFKPDAIEVRQGDVVKLVIQNKGSMLHEMVMGTKAELEEHAAQMLKFPNMEHDEPYMVHVKPGTKGEIIWSFNRAGDFDFACLIAGHYQAGMVGKIKVVGDAKLSNPNPNPAMPVAAATPAAPSSQDMSEAEVRKIDKENKKITLRHGPLKSLNMPPMTMVFQVRDPAALDAVKVGDKIRFNATNEAGKLTAGELQVVK